MKRRQFVDGSYVEECPRCLGVAVETLMEEAK